MWIKINGLIKSSVDNKQILSSPEKPEKADKGKKSIRKPSISPSPDSSNEDKKRPDPIFNPKPDLSPKQEFNQVLKTIRQLSDQVQSLTKKVQELEKQNAKLKPQVSDFKELDKEIIDALKKKAPELLKEIM